MADPIPQTTEPRIIRRSEAAALGWLPIDTAPMDGTVIRLLQGGEVFAGFCGDDAEAPWHFLDRKDRHAFINAFRYRFSPSHWKPLYD